RRGPRAAVVRVPRHGRAVDPAVGAAGAPVHLAAGLPGAGAGAGGLGDGPHQSGPGPVRPDGAGLAMKGDPRALLRACWSPLVNHAAQVYAAGPELADALRVCAAMSRRGIAGTIGYWNRQGEQPRQVADIYLAALDALSREGP